MWKCFETKTLYAYKIVLTDDGTWHLNIIFEGIPLIKSGKKMIL